MRIAVMFGNSSATEEIYSVAFYLTPDKMFFLGIGVLISLFPVERTQWLAETLARAGRTTEARLLLEKMLTYSNHLGLYAEEIGPTGEPVFRL